jgi:hypothetical protein
VNKPQFFINTMFLIKHEINGYITINSTVLYKTENDIENCNSALPQFSNYRNIKLSSYSLPYYTQHRGMLFVYFLHADCMNCIQQSTFFLSTKTKQLLYFSSPFSSCTFICTVISAVWQMLSHGFVSKLINLKNPNSDCRHVTHC